ncbi:MAG: hypothetical protein GTN40_04750 [Candidatus Aenigmarchaeota archaeon]|nr:hypothetical protein [Candidatus Aenigmarchaeota archaeon]
MSKGTAYILSLIAGILTIINGIFVLVVPGILSSIPGTDMLGWVSGLLTAMGAWGIINGIILIYGGYMINKGNKNGGIILLIFSIIGLITGAGGFLIGAILGIIGGILGIRAKK